MKNLACAIALTMLSGCALIGTIGSKAATGLPAWWTAHKVDVLAGAATTATLAGAVSSTEGAFLNTRATVKAVKEDAKQ